VKLRSAPGAQHRAVSELSSTHPYIYINQHISAEARPHKLDTRSAHVKKRIRQSPQKPSPRRVVQERFLAGSVCRQQQMDVKVIPRFSGQQDQLDPMITAMSGRSRVFGAAGGAWQDALKRGRENPGTDCPSGRGFARPMLLVVALCRLPGRRRAGRPDLVVPDGSVGAIAPSLLPIAHRE
jgi:hypothetical protein